MTQTAVPNTRPGIIDGPLAPFGSLFGLARHVAIGGLAGLAAGLLVGGLGSRLFMRIAGAVSGTRGAGRLTEAGFTVGEITFGGTIGLVIFVGILSGIVGAAVYLLMQPWIEWAGRWRGVVFGVLLFALTSATSDVMNPDNVDFFILGNAPLVVALIVLLFVAFGVVADSVFGWLDRRLPGEDSGWGPVGVGYVILTAIGLLIGLSLGSTILLGGEGVCGCEPPIFATLSFGVVALSTAVVWMGGIVRLPTAVSGVVGITGYVGILGVLFFGLLRAVSDAVAIIG